MSKLALLATLLVLGATAVHAQTYNLPSGSTFLCDAESYDGQIVCRGIPLEDSKGTVSGLFYIFSFNREGAMLPGIPYDPYGSITKWNYFTKPANGNPGTFKFEWDQDGHTGTATATWVTKQICGNRCWNHPELLTFIVTAD